MEFFWSKLDIAQIRRSYMADVRLQIPEEASSIFQEKLTERTKPTDIARDAMTLYKWAVDEVSKGRIILTANTEGTDFTKLAMPSLQSIIPKK